MSLGGLVVNRTSRHHREGGARRWLARLSAPIFVGVIASPLLGQILTAEAASTLTGGQWLYPGQYIMSTNANAYGGNGFELVMQGDGNLVLYAPAPTGQGIGRALWASGTNGRSVRGAVMQTDGNLVVYSFTGTALWASGTWGHAGAYLADQNDGNLVIYASNGAALWSTDSYRATDTASLTSNGTCWRPGTPMLCRNTWAGRSHAVYFRAIDQFSRAQPGWLSPAQGAVNAWNNAPGPQYYSFSSRTNDTWVYLVASTSGQHGLAANSYGITWNCLTDGSCFDYPVSGTVEWSNIYINQNLLGGQSGALVQNVFAHELGHAMLLGHNPIEAGALMWPFGNTSVLGPSAYDTGSYPGCSHQGFGTDCIYGWGD